MTCPIANPFAVELFFAAPPTAFPFGVTTFFLGVVVFVRRLLGLHRFFCSFCFLVALGGSTG
jgi:hypothetical protein